MDIGKMALKLSLNAGAFMSDAMKANSAVQSMSQTMSGFVASAGSGNMSIGGILSSLPGPAGAAAVAIDAVGMALRAAGQRGIDFIGEVAGLSKRYQLEIKSANELAIASQRVGIEQDTLGTSFNKMQVAVGKAVGGSAEANAAFYKLGLRAEDLVKMPIDKQFMAVADQLNKMSSESERAAAAQAIFGKSWREIDPLLRKGSGALAEASALTKKFGLEVSDADVKSFREMKQSARDVGMATEGLSLSIGRGLLPILTQLSHATVGLLGAIKPFIDIIGSILGGIGKLMGVIGGLDEGFLKAATAATALYAALLLMRAGMITTGIGALIVGVGFLIGAFNATSEAAKKAQTEVERIAGAAEAAKGPFVESMRSQALSVALVNDEIKRLRGMQVNNTGYDAQIGNLTRALQGLTAEFERLNRVNQISNRLLEENRAAVQAYQDANRDTVADTHAENEAARMAELTNSVHDQIAALHDQAATFGMTAREAQIYKDAMAGANEEDLNALRALDAELSAMEEAKKLQDSVTQILNQADHGANSPKGAAALTEGSSGAVAAVNAAMMQAQTGRQSPEERIEEAIKQAKLVQDEQLQQQRLMREALDRINRLD